MTPLERISQAVVEAQRDGYSQGEIAGVLLSFAAGYPLEIGWSAELVAKSQTMALGLHLDRKGSSRS